MHAPAPHGKADPAPSRALPLAAVAIGNVALAFGPWFVRMADTGPIAAAFWRISLAAPVLVTVALLTSRKPFAGARRHLWLILIGGIAFAADLASWHLGILRTSLANSTLFGNAATLIFPIYGFLVARAWPTQRQGAALLVACIGGGLLLGRSAELSPQNLIGDLLCLLAGVLYAVYFITMARVRDTMAAVPALALSTLASVLPLLLFAMALGERIMPQHWGPVVALAVVSQLIGQGMMIYAIGHLSPLIVGIALLIQPVVAATVGWVVYDERLGLPDLIGALLVAVALVLVRDRAQVPVQLAPAEPEAHLGKR